MPKSSWLTKLGRRVTPSRYRPKVKGYLLKVGMVGSPYRLFAYLYGIVILQTLAIYLPVIYPMLTAPVLDLLVVEIECTPMVTVLVSVVLVCVMYICLKYLAILIVKYYLDILIFKRTKKIEEVLPYYLHGVAVNLKSGMEFNHALLHAVEPEYSVLEKEIEIVAKKEMSGKDLQQALREFADKYNSPILKEVIDLINTGLKGGSNVSEILDRLVENIKLTLYVRKEVQTSVLSYVIFITIIAIFISPILFALSLNLLTTVQGISQQLVGVKSTLLPPNFGKGIVKPELFMMFSRFAVGIIATAAAIIIVNLRKGSLKGGVKYIPVYIMISILVYELSLFLLTSVFGFIFST